MRRGVEEMESQLSRIAFPLAPAAGLCHRGSGVGGRGVRACAVVDHSQLVQKQVPLPNGRSCAASHDVWQG